MITAIFLVPEPKQPRGEGPPREGESKRDYLIRLTDRMLEPKPSPEWVAFEEVGLGRPATSRPSATAERLQPASGQMKPAISSATPKNG